MSHIRMFAASDVFGYMWAESLSFAGNESAVCILQNYKCSITPETLLPAFFTFLQHVHLERKMEPLLENCIQQVVTAAQVELILGMSCR